ncbi:mitochondrial 54S ribosomal protein rml2 [Didymosphaeria variabile]|uniref:Mitochondrial 54S ribosomal protein rml2 n=1 Tax=Didymosphaeria variabile TaxID=1932322 RepID=A0A9W9CB27_9PLEO|nr:mitochondrial 54S ribosomal protein rml2 [Didymosphaeria variabile]KAJ4353289.1 mitochondrial 54S ribosomal protein rml2 [Didymosphaeria variabile]
MLQPRICSLQASRIGRALLQPARSYATAVEHAPSPAFEPAVHADSGVLQTREPRRDKFIPLRTYTHARHRGGGHKRRIRIVDYKRYLPGKHIVDRIEYDPNRSAHLALVTRVETGEKTYIVAADGMREGDEVESYRSGIPKDLIASMGGVIDPGMLAAKTAARGNCLPIEMVPLGSQVFNVGSKSQGGGVFCRSAGTYAIVVTKEEVEKPKGVEIKSVTVRLQSGELRKISPDACCTIGVASNPQNHFRSLGKAGRSRWLGKRPEVRGLAMNAADHPHGGGRGKSKGNVHPVSPWGTPAKGGFKTRHKRNKHTFLVQDRPRNQGKRRPR